MSLDEECFHEHLGSFEFREGAESGRWGFHQDDSVVWPNAVLWAAAPPRAGGPDRFFLFFNLADYPKSGPTAFVWDPDTKAKLDKAHWPKGANDVHMAFRATWNDANALYVPWDRAAAAGHPDWLVQHAGLIWAPSHTIVHYLRLTHELLQSDDYHGI
jgi:hypothetical protein